MLERFRRLVPGYTHLRVFFQKRFILHICKVDENLPENQSPKAKNEPGEFITVFKKSVDEISEFFNQEISQGIKFDAKLYSFF